MNSHGLEEASHTYLVDWYFICTFEYLNSQSCVLRIVIGLLFGCPRNHGSVFVGSIRTYILSVNVKYFLLIMNITMTL
jgi:hypothetical protein